VGVFKVVKTLKLCLRNLPKVQRLCHFQWLSPRIPGNNQAHFFNLAVLK